MRKGHVYPVTEKFVRDMIVEYLTHPKIRQIDLEKKYGLPQSTISYRLRTYSKVLYKNMNLLRKIGCNDRQIAVQLEIPLEALKPLEDYIINHRKA